MSKTIQKAEDALRGAVRELREARLREYAALLVNVGLAVRKGQDLVIFSPVECADFARMCMDEGYKAGAREVVVQYKDDAVTRAKFLYADDSVFDTCPEWQSHLYNDYAVGDAAMLFIAASDPQNLAGTDPGRVARASKSRGEAIATFRRMETNSEFPWCVASVPVLSWAKQVFPDQGDEEAMDRLWSAIFAAVRVKGDGGAVARWKEHLRMLDERKDKLNKLDLVSLRYQNALGTDLVVRLPEHHMWMAGADRTPKGQVFVANMPTEEIFGAPLRDGVDGTVVAAMPLCLDGTVIRDFSLRLEHGKIVEVHAGEGEAQLRNAVYTDEGSCHFGEVALIPYDSPIREQGILYYETLFDENASCHFAFGEAYPCLVGGDKMTPEELFRAGLNHSASGTHVDFMIGTRDLSVTGTTRDGREVPVFVNGNFAI